MSAYGTMGAAVIGGFANGILGAIGQNYQKELIMQQLGLNYHYNELAAENADRRTRNLYNDFYSPSALLRQYREAGLSPSLMFGGTPGQGGMSGAQGNGASGPMQAPIFNPQSILEGALAAAQISNIKAQTKKTEAEAQNISKDTDLKELQRQLTEMTNDLFKYEYDITTTMFRDPKTGEETSLYEMANSYYKYEDFLKAVREGGASMAWTSTERGQQTLRAIFEGVSRFHRDIQILSAENVNAAFQMSIVSELNKQDFPTENAKAALAQIKAAAATSELTEQQKDAWNNLIHRLDSLGSDWKDIIVVLAMIVGNFAQSSNIKINTGDTFITKQE